VKHGVTFEEASTAFGDPLSNTIDDPHDSEGEERFLLIGEASTRRVLVGWHTERGDRIRRIGARVAERRERAQYEQGE